MLFIMKFFKLFGTEGCHLCEIAEQTLSQLLTDNITVELIDITEETQYYENYALKIPVLKSLQTGTELNWPFTLEQAKHFLNAL